MTRYRRRQRVLAACLSAIAGYVDALGFLALGGYFVSFMSGNSTRLAVGVAVGFGESILAGGLIALFVTGVVCGSLVGRLPFAHRQSNILLFVAMLLAAAAFLDRFGYMSAAIAAAVLAMGAENAVFERDGEVSIGVTYMTGTLVKLGQRITAALLGGEPFAWVWYLLLWLGLVLGAIVGAVVYPFMNLQGFWLAAIAATALSVCAFWLSVEEPESVDAPG